MDWLEPWYSVTDNSSLVEGLVRELGRELATGHPLYGLPVRTIGCRQDCDDVLFSIEDGTNRVAVVHLTWTHSPPERLPHPSTVLYPNLEEWFIVCMLPDHNEFHD
jgi:hypothetical protein